VTGRLTVVGIGPGRSDWCTPAVRDRIGSATDLVGYGRYLELAEEAVGAPVAARRHASGNRVEADRARLALDLAADGAEVVVVSSGDAGVFGMGTAIVEQLDGGPDRWHDVAVELEPGVTAASALASRVGAPLGHDFCVLSLSDVRKPWSVIEARLDATARVDLVLALYNLRSRHRPPQLARALEVVAGHRGPDAVVVVGRNVGRDDEAVRVTTLAGLDPSTVDMSTMLIIGSSTTREVSWGNRSLVYTPRTHPDHVAPAAHSGHTATS
jgi:precorrin-2 C20-methyltransferase / precorrin-3B C17-methyltransferase